MSLRAVGGPGDISRPGVAWDRVSGPARARLLASCPSDRGFCGLANSTEAAPDRSLEGPARRRNRGGRSGSRRTPGIFGFSLGQRRLVVVPDDDLHACSREVPVWGAGPGIIPVLFALVPLRRVSWRHGL